MADRLSIKRWKISEITQERPIFGCFIVDSQTNEGRNPLYNKKGLTLMIFHCLLSTGPPAYNDSAGHLKKCHCKRVASELYRRMFSMNESANSAPLSARALVKLVRSEFFSARSMMNSARSWTGERRL